MAWGLVNVLQVVDADNLIDPTDKGGNFDVNSRHVFPSAAEAPRHQAGQLVVAGVLADQRPASVTLEIKNKNVSRNEKKKKLKHVQFAEPCFPLKV